MKSSEIYQPVVETLTNSVNAVIYSTDHLIGYNLAKVLARHQLVVHLVHTQPLEPFLPSPSPQVIQFRFDELKTLQHQGADYFFCIFPSRKDRSTFLAPVIGSCREQASKLLVVEEYGQPQVQDLLAYLKKEAHDIDTRIVLVSTPYGPNFGYNPSGLLASWMLALYTHEALILPSRGQEVIAPLYVDDLCLGLIQAMFKTQTNHQVFVLGSLDNLPLLDVAHKIRDLSEEILGYTPTVDFSNTSLPLHNPPESMIAASQASLSWKPQTDFAQGLRQTLEYLQGLVLPQKVASPVLPPLDLTVKPANGPTLTPLVVKTKRNHLRRISLFLAAVGVILLVSLPGLIFYGNSTQGIQNLLQASTQLEAGQAERSQALAQTARTQFERSRSALGWYRPLMIFFGDKLGRYDRLLDAGIRMSEVEASAADSLKKGQELYRYIIGDSTTPFGDLVSQLKSSLESVYNQVSLVQVALGGQSFGASIDSFESLAKVKTQLPKVKDHLQLALSMLEVLPQVINTPQAVNLLVMIQDAGELRPTGGFNSAYALLTFKEGRLIDQRVEDVSTLDAKLDGRIDPPSALRRHLGEANWYLRDANWSPDFPTTAAQTEWFFDKEAGKAVVGVVAVDTNVLRSLLTATGPITLPVTSQTITDKNMNEASLKEVASGLLTAAVQNQIRLSPLAVSLSDGLGQGGILVFLNEATLQKVVDKYNWSGSLKNPTCPAEFEGVVCTSETLGLFEANTGVNKTNQFLGRAISDQVTVADDGKINHQIEVVYTNQNSGTGNAGTYKTYSRFYAPVGSQLQVNLDQVPVPIEETNVFGKTGLTEFGFYYEIPPGNQKHLSLSLRSPQILSTFSPLSALSVNWQKQPGTTSDPIQVTFIYPAVLKPTQISLPADSQPQRLQFTNQLSSDLVFATEFKQK